MFRAATMKVNKFFYSPAYLIISYRTARIYYRDLSKEIRFGVFVQIIKTIRVMSNKDMPDVIHENHISILCVHEVLSTKLSTVCP